MEESIKKGSVAVICANGLGDGIISMVFAHNLEQQGYVVTTFSNYLTQLTAWFPGKTIAPFPAPENIKKILGSYERIISTDGAFLARMETPFLSKYKIYYERNFDRRTTVLQNFLEICKKDFGLSKVTENNGLQIPYPLKSRHFIKRVIINPTSTSDKKNWPAEKYIGLARKLKKKQFEPVFVVAPAERNEWQLNLKNEFALPEFASLDAVAQFIYESGYMIGNDSGIGHLAANLGLPTLSLFSRQSVANLWRPNWGKGKVVTATLQLPSGPLRTKYWKNFLTVNKVFKFFQKLSKGEGNV